MAVNYKRPQSMTSLHKGPSAQRFTTTEPDRKIMVVKEETIIPTEAQTKRIKLADKF